MEGQKDLAGLFAAMTEAVRSSSDLDDAAQKGLPGEPRGGLEESAKPSEKRRSRAAQGLVLRDEIGHWRRHAVAQPLAGYRTGTEIQGIIPG